MKIQRFLFAIVIASTAFMMGCGATQGEKIAATPSPVADQVKSMLKTAAEDGKPLGSGGMISMEYLAQLEKTDAAKAKSLQADFDALMSAGNPADVKAKAAALLKKLP
jgi:hypothetical protein